MTADAGRWWETRPVTADDAVELHDLEVEVFGEDAWSQAGLEAALPPPTAAQPLTRLGQHGHVALVNGQIVGYAMSRRTDDVCDILRVAVSAHFRRRGLGTVLVVALLEHCRAQGCTRAMLEVAADNAAALACYRRLGFGVLDRRARYYTDGADALVLERVL